MIPVEYRGNVSEDLLRELKKLLPGSLFYYCTQKLRSQVCQLKALFHMFIRAKWSMKQRVQLALVPTLDEQPDTLPQDSKEMR